MIKKNRPVYLCGFMGCGKSTIGRLLAKKLGREFVDLDDYIVQREGMSIPQIFEQRGENYFREVEAVALSELSAAAGVVATGGGTLLKKGEWRPCEEHGHGGFHRRAVRHLL